MPIKELGKPKKFIWYAGTRDTAAKASKRLELKRVENVAHSSIIDGVGTKENAGDTRKAEKTHEKQVNGNINLIGALVKNVKNRLRAEKDTYNGYSEYTHIAQLEAVFEGIGQDNKPIYLVLGGHSRGAAVGVTGFLIQLYALSQLDNGAEFLENINSIKLIVCDPVAGTKENDLMGMLEGISSDNPIKVMMDAISEKAGKPDLFHTTMVTSRFDARHAFEIDNYWKKFAESKPKNMEVFSAGFQHSELVGKNGNNIEMYSNPKITPKSLLQAIIDESLGLISKNDLDKKASALEKIELKLIEELRGEEKYNSDAISSLREKTSRKGYHGIRKLLPMTSLEETLRESSKKETGNKESVKNNGRNVNARKP